MSHIPNWFSVHHTFTDRSQCLLFALGQQGDFWRRAEIHLNSAVNYQVVIEGMSGPGYQGDIAIDDVSFTPSCRPDSTATISPTVPTPTGTTPPGCKTGQIRYEDINPLCNKLATMLCGLWFCGQLPPDRTGQFIPKVESYVIRRSLVIEQWSSRPTHILHFRNTLTVDLVFTLNMLSRSGCLFHRILTLVLQLSLSWLSFVCQVYKWKKLHRCQQSV